MSYFNRTIWLLHTFPDAFSSLVNQSESPVDFSLVFLARSGLFFLPFSHEVHSHQYPLFFDWPCKRDWEQFTLPPPTTTQTLRPPTAPALSPSRIGSNSFNPPSPSKKIQRHNTTEEMLHWEINVKMTRISKTNPNCSWEGGARGSPLLWAKHHLGDKADDGGGGLIRVHLGEKVTDVVRCASLFAGHKSKKPEEKVRDEWQG